MLVFTVIAHVHQNVDCLGIILASKKHYDFFIAFTKGQNHHIIEEQFKMLKKKGVVEFKRRVSGNINQGDGGLGLGLGKLSRIPGSFTFSSWAEPWWKLSEQAGQYFSHLGLSCGYEMFPTQPRILGGRGTFPP